MIFSKLVGASLLGLSSALEHNESRQIVSMLIQDNLANVQEVMRAHERKLTFEEAADKLPNLPKDVSFIVQSKKLGKKEKFSEESLTKARKILNGMIETAQAELDLKVIECKEFHEKNRGTWGQVRTDLARLGEQIADLDRLKSDSINGIAQADAELTDVKELRQKERLAYEGIRNADDAEMTVRKNDLAVAEFIMDITKCPKEGGFVQKKASKHQVLSCTSSGGRIFRFSNAEIQRKIESLRSNEARNALQNALGLAVNNQSVHGDFTSKVLLQVRGLSSAPAPASAATATMPPPTDAPATEPENPAKQDRKCSVGKPNCGLLHDNMSLMWGEMRDAVDSLQAKMDKEEAEWKDLLSNFNQQVSVLTNTKSNLQTQLAEATAQRNADSEEQMKKQTEESELQALFKEVWGECEATIDEILFTNICGVRKVRGEVQKHSTTIKPTDLIDCEVSDFIPGPCSVPCDDEMVGGVQDLTRTVVQAPNEHGTRCPQISFIKKCNQIKCAVDCRVSRWSSFSKCTKECEGGIQTRTRHLVVEPKNGGESCDVLSEQRPCNTGSCDRDCHLHAWTRWSPCSQACDKGYTERFRHVRRPTRGNGKCPKSQTRMRYSKKGCNQQNCIGDEECIAKVDVVLAVDGSGSLKEDGFDTLKNFTGELVKKFKGRAYKNGAMKVGVIQFGNGEILEDKSIAKADIIQGLTDNMDDVAKAVDGLKWRRGFTNMAQAFTMSSSVFLNGGRKSAQSQVLVITDGAPSFKFQTHKAVMSLRDAGVHVNIVAIRNFPGDEIELMKQWASVPWQTHMIHIPGLKKLKQDVDFYSMKTLVQNCPRAESPSQAKEASKAIGYELIAENRDCPCWWMDLGKHNDAEGCKLSAMKKGAPNFVFGKGAMAYYGGQCFGNEKMDGKCQCGWVDSSFDHFRLVGYTAPGAKLLVNTDIDLDEEQPSNVNVRPNPGAY